MEIFISVTMFPIKYVVLCQTRSIFFQNDPRGLFGHIITILIWVNFMLYSSVALALIFACTPREKLWHPYVEGYCIDDIACVVISIALNIASDLSILIIPMLCIARLQMPLKKKLLAASVFAVGALYGCYLLISLSSSKADIS